MKKLQLTVSAALFGLGLLYVTVGFCSEPMGRDYSATPVPFTAVHVSDNFWSSRLDATREVTIPSCFKKCEETRIPNFARAGGLEPGPFRGIYFDDSDLYKIIEGASYVLALQKDEKLDKYVDEVIAKIASAQESDGYLYTSRTIFQKYPQYKPTYTPPGGEKRWSNTGGHELYCVGHMYEAAVAHYLATGKRNFLDIAVKNADLICKTFGVGKFQNWPPGHQEIEIGLVKLYRLTGDKKYLDQAKYFLDIRGRADGRTYSLYGDYCQDHKPVVEQTEAFGHAVRAVYMYSGMADVAAMTGDPSYVKAIQAIWNDVVGSKLYITGGIGAIPHIEGFGKKYELPNDTAYCETCASIANVYWNHRMFLWTGESKYIDVMERSLYNAVLSGVSMKGDAFFYPNVLDSPNGAARSEWFGCSCCPSNISRFLASMPGYMYAVRGSEIYVNLYAASEATIPGVLIDGKKTDVKLKVETNYPWDGKIKITVLTPGNFTIKVRQPGWAHGQAVPKVEEKELYKFIKQPIVPNTVYNYPSDCSGNVDGGYYAIKANWKSEEAVEFTIPMPVQRVIADEQVEADRGLVALQRGPLVYCLEAQDCIVEKTGKPVKSLRALVLKDDQELTVQYDPGRLVRPVTANSGTDEAIRQNLDSVRQQWTNFWLNRGETVLCGTALEAYKKADSDKLETRNVKFSAIPYYAWSHRGRQPMSVWLARTEEAAQALPAPTIASEAKPSASFVNLVVDDSVDYLNDGVVPKDEKDTQCRRWHWWSNETLGKPQWVQYEFDEPTTVQKISVYWFDDTGIGACRVPKSWKLLSKTADGTWQEVSKPSGYETKTLQFNDLTFDSVKTTALKIEIESQPNFAGGIYEWTVQ